MKRRVAILISGRGSNMAALIEAAKAQDFPAEIVAVISNRADAAGLEKAAASGIATIVIESKPFGKDRAGFEAVLQRALDDRQVELMLNIHPSLLPCFPGLDPHGQALRAGVKLSGATVHFVIPETDAGPIVMQGAVTVADDDTAETLAARVITIEHRIYPEALRLLASGRLKLEGDLCKTLGSAPTGGTLIAPAP